MRENSDICKQAEAADMWRKIFATGTEDFKQVSQF
jgi:hypothetical protein